MFLLDSTASNTTNAPTILVNGGSLTVRNSTISETTGGSQAAIQITGGTVDLGTAVSVGGNTLQTSGPGELIRNTSANAILAIGNTFEADATPLTTGFAIEDKVFHALDAAGSGLVTYVADQVYVTTASGSIQRGVNAVTPGGTVNVSGSGLAAYTAGAKLLTVAFSGGPTLTQRPDDFNSVLRTLVVTGTSGNDQIAFGPGSGAGRITVNVTGAPNGTFAPDGRLVADGSGGNDDLEVAGSIELSAWLYGGAGDDRLKGGAGHDALFGELGDDLLVGGNGRDLLIGGLGADRIVGNADDDILIAGFTVFDQVQAAIRAIQSEWTSGASYAVRTGHISGNAGGVNGAHYLVNDGPGATVDDDGASDVLTGSAGQDWFFANLVLDAGDNATKKDKITDLSASEFAVDLDFINS